MAHAKQTEFQKTKWNHRFSHGGILRNSRLGRRERPLSTKDPIHLVFKANRETIRGGFRTHRRFQLIHALIQKYSRRFFIKVEQLSVQGDHLHLVVRISRRSNFQHFMRVAAGQIAQRFMTEDLVQMVSEPSVTATPAARRFKGEGTVDDMSEGRKPKLWKHRPFTRVVKGHRAYRSLQHYVQLNEQEALGKIPYRKDRLRGLPREEWERLWT